MAHCLTWHLNFCLVITFKQVLLLNKGDQILIPLYNLNRDDRYWIGSIDATYLSLSTV